MPRITIELLRKRCEHNEGEIHSLEEIALHQENIEKIEMLNENCRNLRILLLQYNLISKIENLNKLKKLEYLNLALNNIEVLENLEGLESLNKLDLMINFIADVRGVKCLRNLEHLQQLVLSGNPCCDYEGYRDYVIATLPQLRELDMQNIERSERIKALQNYAEATGDVIRGYRRQVEIREKQKTAHRRRREEQKVSTVKIREILENEDQQWLSSDEESNENDDSDFWKTPSEHTPEERMTIAKKNIKNAKQKQNSTATSLEKWNKTPKRKLVLFNSEGKAYNMNMAKLKFHLDDETDADNVVLDVTIRKHLDTSYMDVDVQPTYVRVTIKGKILQLTLPCEVITDKSEAKRNTTTGHLLIIMPRLEKLDRPIRKPQNSQQDEGVSKKVTIRAEPQISKRELLEIGPPRDELDFLKIVKTKKERLAEPRINEKQVRDFVDNPEVPALE